LREIGLTKWGHRSVDVIGLAVCAAFTLGAYFVGIRPLASERGRVSSQESQLAGQRKEVSELNETAAALTRRLRDVNQALERAPLQLKSADEVTWHLARLAELAAETGLEMGETQLGESYNTMRYQTVPIHLAGKGGYCASAGFLHDLSGKFSDTAVSSMEISCDPENPLSAVKLQLNLIWYAAPAHGFPGDS
jgi:Tfp pilus assembly protein PilO